MYRHSKGTISPTGSVQSLTYDWDSPYGDSFNLDSASDVTSTSSSLRDLSTAGDMEDGEDGEEHPTMRELNVMLGFLNSKHS